MLPFDKTIGFLSQTKKNGIPGNEKKKKKGKRKRKMKIKIKEKFNENSMNEREGKRRTYGNEKEI